MRTSSPRLRFFTVSCTPQGLHRLRISACTPLCSVRTALHRATADSSHSQASFDTTSARHFMVKSPLPGDASHVDPSDAGAMCSALSYVPCDGLDWLGLDRLEKIKLNLICVKIRIHELLNQRHLAYILWSLCHASVWIPKHSCLWYGSKRSLDHQIWRWKLWRWRFDRAFVWANMATELHIP